MTPQEKHLSLAAELRNRKRVTRVLTITFASFSLFIVTLGNDHLLNLAIIGTLWLLAYTFVHVDRHVHALREAWHIRQNFYHSIDIVPAVKVDSDNKTTLSASDAAEFDDLVQRFHTS